MGWGWLSQTTPIPRLPDGDNKSGPRKFSAINGQNWQENWSIHFFDTIILNRSLNCNFQNPLNWSHDNHMHKSSINTGTVGKSAIFDVRLCQELLNLKLSLGWSLQQSKIQIGINHNIHTPALLLRTLREAPFWNMLVLYGHCQNSFRPPPPSTLSNGQTWTKKWFKPSWKVVTPTGKRGKRVLQTSLASLYPPPPHTHTLSGNAHMETTRLKKGKNLQ